MKVSLWTDGGCRGNGKFSGPSGIGIILEIENQLPIYYAERLHFDPNTNNKAEIYAVSKGLKLLLDKYKNDNSFIQNSLIIYTDSDYVLKGATRWIKSWRQNNWFTVNNEKVKNKELWIDLDNQMQRVKQDFDVSFQLVKGHSGIDFNEKCDKLANYAMDNPSFTYKFFSEI